MMNVLYTVLIFPLETVIELAYLLVWRMFENPAAAVLGVSVVVSTLTLPLYFMAEKHQEAEREIQKRLKPETANIKAVFRGDERYLMLATWYRQNHYHPVYALRSSIGLIIQIPFFIAAYNFLSGLGALSGASFLFIRDLGAPDGTFSIAGFPVNLLPLLMTLINCAAGAVYTRGFPPRDKVQLYGMALFFLAFLYNSPSGLVLYWTCNNLYSLVKNIAQKNRAARIFLRAVLGIAALALAAFMLLFHAGAFKKRLLVAAALLVPLAAGVFGKALAGVWRGLQSRISAAGTAPESRRTFVFSALAFCLLAGLVIPSGVIASSVEEFAFIAPLESPLPFVGISLLQSAGIFVWLLCLYFLFDRRVRALLGALMTVILAASALNAFAFGGDYGFMTPDLHLAAFAEAPGSMALLNLLALAAVCAGTGWLLLQKNRRVLFSLQNIAAAAFLVIGLMNGITIARDFGRLDPVEAASVQDKAVYTFSKTGKNVVVVMLDRAIPGFMPYILAEKPELRSSLSGFVLYPNCVSFGSHTIYGAPGIFGGYEYSPLEMYKRAEKSWQEVYDESMRVLPSILAGAGFDLTLSNQPSMNPDLYRDRTDIRVENTEGRYLSSYLRQNGDLELVDYYNIIKANGIRFSFFKFMPLALRSPVYDKGDYLSLLETSYRYPHGALDSYANLYYLPRITGITEDNKNYSSVFVNMLTHEYAFFQAPEYAPVPEPGSRGSGPYAGDALYHVNMASLLLLSQWFDFLKDQGVYDNTRIIVVSDHGYEVTRPFPGSPTLPNGDGLEWYNALLMVKDFGADFPLKTEDAFMTNADVIFLAAEGLVEDPRNPFTGKPLVPAKEGGVIISSSHDWNPERRFAGIQRVNRDRWLSVHDDIFVRDNWRAADPFDGD